MIKVRYFGTLREHDFSVPARDKTSALPHIPDSDSLSEKTDERSAYDARCQVKSVTLTNLMFLRYRE